MAPVFTNAVNLQKDSPLFSKIPQELRNEIFDLVVTPHPEKHVHYPEELRYPRPGLPRLDRSLSATLLRCCQLIYFQTCDLPAKKYVLVDWLCDGKVGHGYENYKDGNNRFDHLLPKALRNLHLFTTKFWLNTFQVDLWDPYAGKIAAQAPNLEYLKTTLEHDNSPFRFHDDVVPSPKRFARSIWFWGHALWTFENLTLMELEVETLEEQMEKLDLVLAKAAAWRFSLASGRQLVLNSRKTKWEGWHGPNLGERMEVIYRFSPGGADNSYLKPIPGFRKDPVAARKRLIEAGVDFITTEDASDYTSDDCETYCVATLVFEALGSAQMKHKANADCCMDSVLNPQEDTKAKRG